MPKAIQYTKGSIIYFSGDRDDRIFILQKGMLVFHVVHLLTTALSATDRFHGRRRRSQTARRGYRFPQEFLHPELRCDRRLEGWRHVALREIPSGDSQDCEWRDEGPSR